MTMSSPPQSKRYGKMSMALIVSLIVHAVIIVVAIVGLPYLKREHPVPESISVELATIADITQANKPPVKTPEPEEKKDEPPKPVEQKQPPRADPKPVFKPEPKVEEKKDVKADKPLPDIDELAPPKKPDKKPDKKSEQKKPEKKQADFQALLKSLAKNEPEQKSDIKELTEKLTKAAPSPETPSLSDKLTISDIDALRQQLSGCWNILGGAAEAQDLSVDIRVIVNPNRIVQQASIMDQARYNADDRFRAAADSALRAVRDPRCSPLNVPPDKYRIWHDMVINFDPKDMF